MSENHDLIDFVSSVSGDAYLKVEESFSDGFVRLRTSEAERRQAKHDVRSFEDIVVELLRNARDAHAQRIFIATVRDGQHRRFTMIDDGIGVPASLHERIFEPRVTSKLDTMVMDRWGVHGRGMALYSVRTNVESCRIASSDLHKGASITLESDVEALPERSDQSTWPVVERDDAGLLRVSRGPHNIVRKVLEFACEHPQVDIYLGSPAEVLATLHLSAREVLDSSELLFCDSDERLPIWQRPAIACDASDLVEVADQIALPISERTAHRILVSEIAPLDTVLSHALEEENEGAAPPAAPDIYRDRRGLKIHHADLARFRQELTSAFDTLAERYYLHLKGDPKVTVTRDGIRVRFDVDKEE